MSTRTFHERGMSFSRPKGSGCTALRHGRERDVYSRYYSTIEEIKSKVSRSPIEKCTAIIVMHGIRMPGDKLWGTNKTA